MYKLTQLDGTDFYSGTINYAENIGKIIRVKDYDGPEFGACGRGIHASRNPNDCFIGARIPCRAFKIQGIQRIEGDKKKTRYQAVKVLEEITDLDKLFGWKYSEVVNPIHPFKIKPPKIAYEHIKLLEKWASVRDLVWGAVSSSAWASVWDSIAENLTWEGSVWHSVGNLVWDTVRNSVGASVTYLVMTEVMASGRNLVKDVVWDSIRASILAYVGSMFPNIKKWKYIDHKPGEYPFQSAVDLWKQGLVPSFNSKTWRLHGGEKAKILWEGEM